MSVLNGKSRLTHCTVEDGYRFPKNKKVIKMQVFKEQFLMFLLFVAHVILMLVLSGCIIKLLVVVLRLN